MTNSEITNAWNLAQKAAEKYGDYLTALEKITDRLASKTSSMGSSVSSAAGGSGFNNNNGTPGKVGDETLFTNQVKLAVARMKKRSEDWHSATPEEQKSLAEANVAEAEWLKSLGMDVWKENGVWYVNTSSGKKKLFEIYHSGGIVGNNGTLKQDETFAKLQNGEMVLTDKQQKTMFRVLDNTETIFAKLGNLFGMGSGSFFSKLTGSAISDSEIMYSSNGGDVINVAPEINITVENASNQAEIARMGRKISDMTIDSIIDAFAKRGKISTGRALLKP